MAETFELDLVFALPKDAEEDVLLDALFEAGFDEAMVGSGASGFLGLSLERRGDDAAIARTAAETLRALLEGAEQADPRLALGERPARAGD